MKNLPSTDLNLFVDFVDNECNGNLNAPKAREKFSPINLVYKTKIDETSDPFSDEYFQSQLDLYEEIAGRRLNQWSGELHPVDIPALINCPNPQGINMVDHVSENVRVLSSMLSLSCLEPNAHILDMGAGHGMSSEIYAFCGCRVHAIDIDPNLHDLAIRRAEVRSLKITRSVLNFDSLHSVQNNEYDAAFFFQSLHHSLRPWDLIAELKQKLADNGVFAFCGEPINNYWKNWGVRLDEESLYVARKYGWFESGWSREFISECFNRNGLKLILLEGGQNGGLIGITSKNLDKLNQIIAKAAALGFSTVGSAVAINSFYSQIGALSLENTLRPSIKVTSKHSGGYLCYGPYIEMPAGSYRVSFLVTCTDNNGRLNSGHTKSFLFDIVSGGGKQVHYKEEITLDIQESMKLVNIKFVLTTDANLLEARVYISENSEILETSLPVFEAI